MYERLCEIKSKRFKICYTLQLFNIDVDTQSSYYGIKPKLRTRNQNVLDLNHR